MSLPIKPPVFGNLEFRYVRLPQVDLSFRFMYSIFEPMELVWQEGRIYNSHLLTAGSLETALKAFAQDEWKKACDQSRPGIPEVEAFIANLCDIKTVVIREFEFAPKA